MFKIILYLILYFVFYSQSVLAQTFLLKGRFLEKSEQYVDKFTSRIVESNPEYEARTLKVDQIEQLACDGDQHHCGVDKTSGQILVVSKIEKFKLLKPNEQINLFGYVVPGFAYYGIPTQESWFLVEPNEAEKLKDLILNKKTIEKDLNLSLIPKNPAVSKSRYEIAEANKKLEKEPIYVEVSIGQSAAEFRKNTTYSFEQYDQKMLDSINKIGFGFFSTKSDDIFKLNIKTENGDIIFPQVRLLILNIRKEHPGKIHSVQFNPHLKGLNNLEVVKLVEETLAKLKSFGATPYSEASYNDLIKYLEKVKNNSEKYIGDRGYYQNIGQNRIYLKVNKLSSDYDPPNYSFVIEFLMPR